MTPEVKEADYELLYWPLPFRGCFVSYLFAYRDVPLMEITDFDEVNEQKARLPSEQPIPFIGPPTLRHRNTGFTLNQMPAIVTYVSQELHLMPEDPLDAAIALKILMDCNDILMELCRYNGSIMWEREAWIEFRSQRFPRWLAVLEESVARGFFGRERASFADIGVYALLGNMIRCLPELETDIVSHAPRTRELCTKIGAQPSLASFVDGHEKRYGKLYCGGYIEESIRKMLEMDLR